METRGSCFSKEDVGAAVNWLKEKLENKSRSNVKGCEELRYPVDFYRIVKLIDEAFADVVLVLENKAFK